VNVKIVNVMNHVVAVIATANRRSKMKNILKLILSAIFIFGSVPTLNASDMKMDNMEEIKKKKKKKGKSKKKKKANKKKGFFSKMFGAK
jgi:mannitol-specific phosphotransferase system IIBC component